MARATTRHQCIQQQKKKGKERKKKEEEEEEEEEEEKNGYQSTQLTEMTDNELCYWFTVANIEAIEAIN